MIVCKNCQSQVGQQYCPNCGQKASVKRITIPSLLEDLPHAVFHIDKGFLYNFLQLFKSPGQAILNYLSGMRKFFFHPASFLVISLVLNYLVVKLTDMHFYDQHELQTIDPVKAEAILAYDGMQWWFLEHTYIYILIAIPASTLFLFLLFRLCKLKLNMAETAVAVLFTIAQGVLMQTIIYLLFGWVDSGPFLRTMETVNICLLVLYASYVIFQLLSTIRKPLVRGLLAFVGGAGLAITWLASAYLLFVIMG